jgi:hypothetical protein
MKQTKNENCIICLSDVGDISTKHTHLGCKCNVPVHTHCWMQYVKTKNGQLECPLCRVLTIRNPILPASITGLPKELIVQQREYERRQSIDERDNCVGKYACCCLVSWVSTVAIAALFA